MDNTKNTKKEKDYYSQVINYAKAAEAKYAVLVSELETDNNYLIRKVKENELPNLPDSINLFVVRPEALMTLLHLLKRVSVIEADVMQTERTLSEEYELKKNLIQNFEKFKKDLLDTTIHHIKNNLEEILKIAEKINKNSQDIINKIQLICDRHIITFENKLKTYTHKLTQKTKKLLNPNDPSHAHLEESTNN